jgi:hypothetical protein
MAIPVPRGSCRVQVERNGYESWDRTVEVGGGATVRHEVQLAQLPDGVAAGRGGLVDANTLLAHYKGGKVTGDSHGDGDGTGAPADSSLPAHLSMAQVASALRKKHGAVDSCVKSAGMPLPFRVNARVIINGSGRVTSASAPGSGAAESCVKGVLRSIRFPQFKGDDMTVPFPFTVR